MRTFISNLLLGKDCLASALVALAIIGFVALGCNSTKNPTNAGNTSDTTTEDPNADPDMPDERLLNALVKETTADFSYAISTEDFSKMYSKASVDFQKTYTPDQMKDVFKTEIANKRTLLPVLAKLVSMDPVYSPEPQIRKEQGVPILVVNGKYDLKPKPLEFTYEYVKRGGQFKLLKLMLR